MAISTGAIVIWLIAALLAVAIFWGRYEARRTREKFLQQLMALDLKRRRELLDRLSPRLASELRGELGARRLL